MGKLLQRGLSLVEVALKKELGWEAKHAEDYTDKIEREILSGQDQVQDQGQGQG